MSANSAGGLQYLAQYVLPNAADVSQVGRGPNKHWLRLRRVKMLQDLLQDTPGCLESTAPDIVDHYSSRGKHFQHHELCSMQMVISDMTHHPLSRVKQCSFVQTGSRHWVVVAGRVRGVGPGNAEPSFCIFNQGRSGQMRSLGLGRLKEQAWGFISRSQS